MKTLYVHRNIDAAIPQMLVGNPAVEEIHSYTWFNQHGNELYEALEKRVLDLARPSLTISRFGPEITICDCATSTIFLEEGNKWLTTEGSIGVSSARAWVWMDTMTVYEFGGPALLEPEPEPGPDGQPLTPLQLRNMIATEFIVALAPKAKAHVALAKLSANRVMTQARMLDRNILGQSILCGCDPFLCCPKCSRHVTPHLSCVLR